MKSFLVSLSLFGFLALVPELELCKAQSLTSPDIKSFLTYQYTSIGLRSKHTAPKQITGSGTSTDPYVLYDALDVDSIRYLGMNNKYYELGNSIDLFIDPKMLMPWRT